MDHLLDNLHSGSSTCSPPRFFETAASPKNVSLLQLTPDLLRRLAYWLPPRDRLNFALTCQHVHGHVWGRLALADLVERFPLERRVQFYLSVALPSPPPSYSSFSSSISPSNGENPARAGTYRMVPQRARQQHVNVAISSDGACVAVLPYDNRLRLIDVAQRRIDAVVDVAPVFCYDVWDVEKGRRKAGEGIGGVGRNAYADEAGIDVEVGLDFSADDSLVVVSGRSCVSLFRVERDGGRYALRHKRDIRLDGALAELLGEAEADYGRGVGGTATLSPDGRWLSWVVFCGTPASVYTTFWDVRSGRCCASCEVATIHPRRWSALGWARVAYAPNGRYCLLVVNAAKKTMRVERVRNEYRRTKLCRYVLAVFDTGTLGEGAGAGSSGGRGGDMMRVVAPVRTASEWLELGAEVYAKGLGTCVAEVLQGLQLHVESTHAFGQEKPGLSAQQQLGRGGVALNSLHSCMAEATYKGLTFGAATRHKWFVSKQPMYSLHFGMCGERILVATSPHANAMQTLVQGEQGFEEKVDSGERGGWRDGPGRRKQVFRRLPWRTSFAAVTGFSTTGKWVAGAALLDDDQCCVCVRNVTVAEYFG